MKITKTTFFLGCLVGGMGAGILPLVNGFFATAHADTRLLPFQGRLTDSAGTAVADGAKVVEFKIYDAPTGGTIKWSGEVHKLSVNGGLVSTMLGSKASLGTVNFATPTFLQITVDANGDGQITAADPPLLPRQSLVPSVYAAVAGQIQYVVPAAGGGQPTVASKGWEAVFDNGNPLTGTISGTKLANGSVSGTKITSGSLPASAITANNQLTAAHLANDSVNTGEIANNAVTSGKIANGTILLEDLAQVTRQQMNPPGTIITYAGAVTDEGLLVEPIPGYLLCNGAVIDGQAFDGKYAALRAVLGNAWGNGGTPEFTDLVNLPDLRGVFLRGLNGSASGIFSDPDVGDPQRPSKYSGGNVGNRVGSFQGDEFKSHSHPYVDRYRNVDNSADDSAGGSLASPSLISSSRTTSPVGGLETRPKNANVVFLIKY